MHRKLSINLPDVKAKKAVGEILTSANLTDYNSFEDPNNIKLAPFKEIKSIKAYEDKTTSQVYCYYRVTVNQSKRLIVF